MKNKMKNLKKFENFLNVAAATVTHGTYKSNETEKITKRNQRKRDRKKIINDDEKISRDAIEFNKRHSILYKSNSDDKELNRAREFNKKLLDEDKNERKKERKIMKNFKTFNEAIYSYLGEYEEVPFKDEESNAILKPGDNLSNAGKCVYIGLTLDEEIVFHYDEKESILYIIDIDDFYTKYIR